MLLYFNSARIKLRFDLRLLFSPFVYRFCRQPKMKLVAQQKDLESDEALWALYERWCKALTRSVTMMRWFAGSRNSRTLLLVHRTNNANLPYKLAINKFAYGKLMEKCTNPDKRDAMIARKAGKSSVLLKPGDRFFEASLCRFQSGQWQTVCDLS